MSKKYPILHIHTGQTKTGSTAIQSFLQLNRKKLFEAGILYPNFNVQGYTSGQCLNHGDFFKQFKDEPDEVIKEFDKLFKFCEKYEVGNVVISVEWFSFPWWAEMMGKIVNHYGCDHKVIIYLKRQDYWVESAWKQWGYKNKAYSSIQEYYNSTNLDWFIRLKSWLENFQIENICLYPFEREIIGNDVVTHFMNIVGVGNYDGFAEMREKSSLVNHGFNPLVIKILEQSKHLLKSEHDTQLQTYLEVNLSDRFKKSSPFHSYGLLSPKERIHLLERYEDSNRKIAHLFFGQHRETLFLEPWPDPEEPYQSTSSMILEDVIPLFMDLMFNQYQELQKVKKQIKLINLNLNKLSHGQGEEFIPKVSSWIPIDLSRIMKHQKNLHQIQLDSINDQFCILTSLGNDPYFVIPFNVRPIFRSAIRLKITVPLETFVNIYFKNGIFQHFSENRSLRFKVRPGTHELIIELPGNRFPGDIRIDPGDVPGKYIIHRLEMGT